MLFPARIIIAYALSRAHLITGKESCQELGNLISLYNPFEAWLEENAGR